MTLTRRLLGLAVLLAVRAATPLPVAAQDPLPLDNAIQLALAHNRQVASASLQVDKAGDALAIAKTRRLPVLDVNFQAGQLLTPLEFTFPTGAFGSFPTTGPIPPAETTIATPRRPAALLYATFAQPLSQLHRINLGVRASELDQDAERERLRRARQALVTQVKRLYYGMLQIGRAHV